MNLTEVFILNLALFGAYKIINQSLRSTSSNNSRSACSGRCCNPETGRPHVSKNQVEDLEKRLGKLETDVVDMKDTIERQTLLIGRLTQMISIKESLRAQEGNDETRSDTTDFVDLSVGKLSRATTYEFASWSPEQVIKWVEKVVGNDSQNAFFANVDGHVLYGMIFEHDHGLSFADKCFFLGVDRESSTLLEKDVVNILKH
jgi:hypothetical protein